MTVIWEHLTADTVTSDDWTLIIEQVAGRHVLRDQGRRVKDFATQAEAQQWCDLWIAGRVNP